MKRTAKRFAAICMALALLLPASPVLADQTITEPGTASVLIGATVDSSYVVTLPTAIPAASFSKDTEVTTLPEGAEAAYRALFTARADGNIPADKKVMLTLTQMEGVYAGDSCKNFLLYKDGDTTTSDTLEASISFFASSYVSPAAQTSCEWRSGSVNTSSIANADNLGNPILAFVHYFTAHKAGSYSRNLSFTIGYEDVT